VTQNCKVEDVADAGGIKAIELGGSIAYHRRMQGFLKRIPAWRVAFSCMRTHKDWRWRHPSDKMGHSITKTMGSREFERVVSNGFAMIARVKQQRVLVKAGDDLHAAC